MGDTLTTMDRLGFPDWPCIALSGLAIAVSHGAPFRGSKPPILATQKQRIFQRDQRSSLWATDPEAPASA